MFYVDCRSGFDATRSGWRGLGARKVIGDGTGGAIRRYGHTAADGTHRDAGRAAMPDNAHSEIQKARWFGLLRVPLFRLLAINLAAGTAAAALFVGGLLALNPANLRDLILADSSPGTALGLLLVGFVVTFGSTAMGTAIMAMGQREKEDDRTRGPPRLVAQQVRDGSRRAALPRSLY